MASKFIDLHTHQNFWYPPFIGLYTLTQDTTQKMMPKNIDRFHMQNFWWVKFIRSAPISDIYLYPRPLRDFGNHFYRPPYPPISYTQIYFPYQYGWVHDKWVFPSFFVGTDFLDQNFTDLHVYSQPLSFLHLYKERFYYRLHDRKPHFHHHKCGFVLFVIYLSKNFLAILKIHDICIEKSPIGRHMKAKSEYWVTKKEMKIMERGECNGMTEMDVRACREGQSLRILQSMTKKIRLWDESE